MFAGVVKVFFPEEGYGWIVMDGGTEVFVHFSGIKGTGFRYLIPGQRVQFDISSTHKGDHRSPLAVNVEVLEE
nr:cold shock domain-containing protein [Alicyclobacillus cellulosilyticus]